MSLRSNEEVSEGGGDQDVKCYLIERARCLRMDHSFSKVKVMSGQGLLNLIKSGRRETGAVSSFKFY